MQKILLRQKYRISLFVLLSLIVGLIDISFALIIQLFINISTTIHNTYNTNGSTGFIWQIKHQTFCDA